ncbi:right-handed parallel beta-helix repeat-containing protein [Agrococcus jenensis]|uniref:Parallel beta helix pectate lyase-like protein n=1 Tax=Agrococcus jenensis TaxID=46353 RepID=A0A3N2AWK1_9MICO|nr:right-handed parallel beta-helix repeat-containing protein [Agrococcus jenensis]ROR67401.1 parallel beta helix pectate lyase-like protein [Agrococcus jenensis]
MPAGTSLRVHQGDLVITEPGTVIDGLDIHGFVDVRAANVTIRNSIVRGGEPGAQDSLVRSATDGASLTITDSELVATVPWATDGLRGSHIDAQRLEIRNVLDGAHFWGDGDVTLQDSWIHGILHFASDPRGGGPSHDDAIQIQSGSDYVITGNRIEGGNNAAIQLTQDAGPTSDVRISGNWLDGGACSVNLAQKDQGPLQGIAVTDNTFGRSTYNCAIIRPAAGSISTSGNVDTDGDAAVVVVRG